MFSVLFILPTIYPFTMDRDLEARLIRKRKIRNLILSLLLLALIGSVIFFWEAIVHSIKAWRSSDFYQKAKESYEHNDYPKAIPNAILAVQLDPNNKDALSLLTEMLTSIKRVEAFTYWDKLLQHEDLLTDALLEEYIILALDLKHLEKAAPHLERLLNSPNPTVRQYLLGIRYYQIEFNQEGAFDLAKKAYKDHPTDPSIQLLIAQLLLQTEDPLQVELAYNILWQISNKAEPKFQLQAIHLLLDNFSLPEADRAYLLSLDSLSSPSEDLLLSASTIKIKLDPSKKAFYVKEALNYYMKSKQINKLQLGRWLNSQKAYLDTLNLISEEDALDSEPLLIIYLDALAGANRWDDLYHLLFEKSITLDPFILQLFKTRIAIVINNKKLAEVQRKLAFTIAKNEPVKLKFMAEYFQKLRYWDYAWEAYEVLLDDRNYAMDAARNMIGIAEFQKETPKIYTVLKSLVRNYPKEYVIQADLTYIELLLDQNIPEASQRALKLYNQSPSYKPMQTTLALAYLKTNTPEKALKLYTDQPLNFDTAFPGWQAIYIATLAANNHKDEAKALYQKIDKNRLKPEETNLILSYL